MSPFIGPSSAWHGIRSCYSDAITYVQEEEEMDAETVGFTLGSGSVSTTAASRALRRRPSTRRWRRDDPALSEPTSGYRARRGRGGRVGCLSHLGHVFDDGSQDACGQRWRMNSIALDLDTS